jgi:hypothetical protein
MVMGAGSGPVCAAPERLAPLWRRAVARTHREGMAHTAAYHEGPSVALRLVTAAWDDGAAGDRRVWGGGQRGSPCHHPGRQRDRHDAAVQCGSLNLSSFVAA